MDSVRSSAPASGQPAGDGATSRTSGGGANAQYTTRTSRSAAAQDPQAQDADGDEAIGSDCVRIGDIVFLHGVDVVGLLFADGFVDEVSVLTKAKDLAEKREALKAKENRAGKDHYREQAHMV